MNMCVDVMETVLLLVCDHLQHAPRRRALGLGTSAAGPLAGFGQLASDTADEALRRAVEPVLARLESLELVRRVLLPSFVRPL